MPGIVEFPRLVQDALAQYGDLFANECQRRHFAEYLTGLIVAERKTVLGIHDEFARITDPSCLNRYLTEAVWDAQALNERRLAQLQKDPSTRYNNQPRPEDVVLGWPPRGGRSRAVAPSGGGDVGKAP